MSLEEITTALNELYSQYQLAPDYFKEFVNSMLTAPITITSAEISSQAIINLEIKKKKYHIGNFKFNIPTIKTKKSWKEFKFDKAKIKYTAKVSPILGFMIYGTVRSGEIPKALGVKNEFVRAALGPNIVGLGYNALWYYVMNAGEKTKYKVKDVFKNMTKNSNFRDNIPKDGFYFAATMTLTLWNVIMGLNYSVIPQVYQTPIVLFTSFCTNTAMALTLKDDYIKDYGTKVEHTLTYVPKKIALGYNSAKNYLKRV